MRSARGLGLAHFRPVADVLATPHAHEMNSARRTKLHTIATDFLEGRLLPLEAAWALAAFEDEAPPDLKRFLKPMVGVTSETDDIPLGDRRNLWHPDVRASEDRKHDEAQAWAEPTVREMCERLIEAL